MKTKVASVVVFIFIHCFSSVNASEGDRSPFYHKCVNNCLAANCTEEGASFTPKAADLQDIWSRSLRWSCHDECRYHCMWKTIHGFQERGYRIPKFHGKWPFKRFFGVQEPASAFSSLLNLAAHAHMWRKVLRDRRFSVTETPLLIFWHLFFAVCSHAWAWSAIFHTRDWPFTEFMDYACALSMVMALFVAAVVRVFHTRRRVCAVVLLFALVYFVEHARYLRAGGIDYEYNMTVNVCCGVLGSLTWLSWALIHWVRNGTAGRYVWRLVLFNKLSGAALLLELVDIPPLGHVWDTHALWHLCTAPLPLLFYRFVIDDLAYMQAAKAADKKISDKADLKLA